MGRRLVLTMLLILVLLLTPTVCRANSFFTVGSPHYLLNGQSRAMDFAPFIKNQRTYIPVRNMGEALGVNVEWDAHARMVGMRKGDRYVQFRMGSRVMKVNGIDRWMDAYPEIVHDRVVLPFRWVAQAFDTNVTWDNEKKTVCFENRNHQVRYPPPKWQNHYSYEPSGYTDDLRDLGSRLDEYFEDAGDDYLADDGISTDISLSGDEDDLAYTVRMDFSGADHYDDLTEVSTNRIKNFLNAVRSRIESEINGTDFEDADITGRLYDNDRPSYYVSFNGSSYTFSWDEDHTSVSWIGNRLDEYFEDAGDDYLADDGISTDISLSGDEDDLAYTVRMDFSGADRYDDLTEVSTNRIKNFLNAVRSRIESEIDDTDFEDADITGRLYDNDRPNCYVRYNGSRYDFSW